MPFATSYKLHTGYDYYELLAREVDNVASGQRIDLVSMDFNPGEAAIGKLVETLVRALQRDVSVNLVIDAYAFTVRGGNPFGPFFWHKKLPAKMKPFFEKKRTALRLLESHGASCTIINIPKRPLKNPFSGRSHTKFSLVNGRVYIGGCNLSDIRQIDMMVSWEDSQVTQYLRGLVETVKATGNMKTAMNGEDVRLAVDATTDIFLDAGHKFTSLILDEAFKVISEAKRSLLITCQYYPANSTAERLKKAYERGAAVSIVYNDIRKHPISMRFAHYAILLYEKMRLPASFFTGKLPLRAPYLHSKLIASDRGAVIGSHNYVTQGVSFGTAEIALISRDPEFAAAITEALIRHRDAVIK